MLAPILAFTADEAWEFVPGKPTESFMKRIGSQGAFIRAEEIGTMELLFKLREAALAANWRRRARPS